MSKNDRMVGISRRTLVKSTAIGSLALAAGGFSLPFTLRSAAAAVTTGQRKSDLGACSVNCGSRCALRLHVKDNEVTWVETDNTGSDEYGNHQVRACLRGRSIRRRINHPDRLNYPMKRVHAVKANSNGLAGMKPWILSPVAEKNRRTIWQ